MEDKLRDFATSRDDFLLVFLYGSHAHGQATSTSDVDVAILAVRPFTIEELLEITSHLRQLLLREIDLVDLRTAHGALLSEILTRGKLVLRRDPEAYAQLIKRMWYEREDEGRFLQTTLNERLKQWPK